MAGDYRKIETQEALRTLKGLIPYIEKSDV